MDKNSNREKFKLGLKNAVVGMETILSFIILVTVILSMKDLIGFIYHIVTTNALESYELVQGFFAHILLLVVGLELAHTLLTHTPRNVLDVMLYAVARKLLISSTNAVDILLGVISLGLLFFIDKFLLTNDNGSKVWLGKDDSNK